MGAGRRRRRSRQRGTPTIWKVPDALWDRIAILFPIEEFRPTGGRPWAPPRRMLDGVLQFDYDSLGRLIQDADPAGGVKTLARTTGSGTFTVSIASQLGRTSTYKVDQFPDGSARQTNMAPTALQNVMQIAIDGSRSVSSPSADTT